MIKRLSDGFGIIPPPEFAALFELMTCVMSDEQYKELVTDTFSKQGDWEQRKGLLLRGLFSRLDFGSLLLAKIKEGQTANISNTTRLLAQLVDWSIVGDIDQQWQNQLVRYSWNKPSIGLFNTLRILDNVLLGRNYIIEKYKLSIPALIVEKENDEHVGTGFLVHNHYGGKHFTDRGYVVTAKHNVDPAENLTFKRFDGEGRFFKCLSETWIFHPELDLAAMPVETMKALPICPIYPLGEQEVLSPTVSLGYPRISTRTVALGYPQISTSDGLYLLAHSGELNAVITSYMDKQQYLVISHAVAPGNSGGPVLNEAGLCVGMVVRELAAKHDGGDATKANAALPAKYIQEFIRSLDAQIRA